MREIPIYICLCQFQANQPIVFARHCRNCPAWHEKKAKLKELLRGGDIQELAVLHRVSERSLHRWVGSTGNSQSRFRGLRRTRWGGKTIKFFLTEAGRGKMGEVKRLLPAWIQDKDTLNALMTIVLLLPQVSFGEEFNRLFNAIKGGRTYDLEGRKKIEEPDEESQWI